MSFAAKFAAAMSQSAPVVPFHAARPQPVASPSGAGRVLVTGQGRTVTTTMDDAEAMDLCGRLPAWHGRRDFVASLREQLHRRGSLSTSQWAWVHLIAQEQLGRELGGDEEPTEANPLPASRRADLSAIISMFDKSAENGLKRPRIVFTDLPCGEVRFTRTSRGREPGSVGVEVRGEYAGRISRDGTWASRGRHEGLDAFMADFAADPWAVAARHGKKSGRCCFCARKLTDAKEKGSIEMGYGPICAAKYGKPHGK